MGVRYVTACEQEGDARNAVEPLLRSRDLLPQGYDLICERGRKIVKAGEMLARDNLEMGPMSRTAITRSLSKTTYELILPSAIPQNRQWFSVSVSVIT